MTPLRRNYWLLLVTALLPPLFQFWPLPEPLMLWRPMYPLVFVAFWASLCPWWMGGLFAFIYGVVVEQMAGLPSASYAFSCVLLAVSIKGNYARFQLYSLPQQTAYVWAVILVALIVSMPWRYELNLPSNAVAVSLGISITTAAVWLLCRVFFQSIIRQMIQKHV